MDERVTNEDATILCAYHEGWLVDMDEGHGGEKNNFLKKLISDAEGQGRPGQPGQKWGDHNDWGQQNCLTFLKDQDIFGFGPHHWNDWGCDQLARYICERAPLVREA